MKKNKEEEKVQDTMDEYRLNGMCIIKGILKENEVKLLQKESLRLWSEQENLTPHNLRVGIRKDLDGKDVLERLDPVHDISKIFSDLNKDPKILKLAREALGEPVIVLKEKLIYKWPGSSGYGAHRDEPYFTVSEDGPPGINIVSIAVALDKADAENGAIKFYPDLRFTKLSSPEEEPKDISMVDLEGKPFIMPELNPGDIVLFDGLIPHSSSFNKSNHSRRIYIITFAPQRYTECRKDYYRFRYEELSKERKKDYEGDIYIK